MAHAEGGTTTHLDGKAKMMCVVSSPEEYGALEVAGAVNLTLGPMWCTGGPLTLHQQPQHADAAVGYRRYRPSIKRRFSFTVQAQRRTEG
jgi:hypothetical protein